ncbi:MAG: hypothetical protein IJW13_01915 [Clostridia bacterium]|nr:hypothetical protein [Clostridia bacterium]
MEKNKIIKTVVTYLIVTFIAFIVYYLALPPINLQAADFWIFLAFLLLIYLAPVSVTLLKGKSFAKNIGHVKMGAYSLKANKLLMIALIPLVVVIIGGAISSEVFNARAYAAVITVNESVFEEDMPQTDSVTNIALMDTQSARIVGNRTLGSLSDVVSQFEISDYYNQINYQNTPKKVSNLEYVDFFKWLGNRASGVPGFVMVDPVNNTAEYIKLSTSMKYAESGYFGDDLMRKLRFSYPTKIFGTPKFEVDDNLNPVYVVPCYKPRVALFGAMDVNEVVIFDPCTGESNLYAIGEVPTWIDIVYDGDLASEKYNWHGTLSGGWFNSIVGNKGCKQTTDDYGYLALNDDVWYFTGVTSVTSDESNIGFILTNARTGEYKYYSVIGAEEHSAMGAAEGEVQEKGYEASFPALINVSGEATYVMVLKDSNGLVKLYALVNVEQYGIVATGATQQEAMAEYKRLLSENGILDGDQDNSQTYTITVLQIKETVIDGNTVYYYQAEENGQTVYYMISLKDDQSALFIKPGDSITVSRALTQTQGIYNILSWQFLN